MTEGIVFQVDTARVLQILAREIYDSPLAMLRENVQNAYDAVRMQFVRDGTLAPGGRIHVSVSEGQVAVADNGIGMTEAVLTANFWKAGSSGKQSEAAQRAGVVGTFGIGAMANFGVCTHLVVETRASGSDVTLRSSAARDLLKIGETCIALDRSTSSREVGTSVTATLDSKFSLSVAQARSYLDQFVSTLPVPVYLNDELISQCPIQSRLAIQGRVFTTVGSRTHAYQAASGTFDVQVDANGQALVHVHDLSLGGVSVAGEMWLLQGGGPLSGLRSNFGLAPVPVGGHFQFGGVANLSFLQPTAGREALSRETIVQASWFVAAAEQVAAEFIAGSSAADKSTAFMAWAMANERLDLIGRITIHVLPEGRDVELGMLQRHIGGRTAHYYTGTDGSILRTFANDSLCLLQIAQSNPRRGAQLKYVQNTLRLGQVPDRAQLTRLYRGPELSLAEASTVLRATAILRDDYLLPEANVELADISHGVAILVDRSGEAVQVRLARGGAQLRPVVECYDRAYDVFIPVVKDFIRVHVYPHVQQFVPSSTRQGVDALRRILQKNRELYRYEETERGDIEGLLGDYLSGTASMEQIVKVARSSVRGQSQRVSSGQVGTVENVVPDIVHSPVHPETGAGLDPSPPIVRDEVNSEMKVLTTSGRHPQLNNFSILLGLSDKLMREYADFFRSPHTTRIIWGGHRVIYIFTDATGRLSLYYDIQLQTAVAGATAGGGMFPTTTLITKRRIFVPVPEALTGEFSVSSGAKEFFVRFDML